MGYNQNNPLSRKSSPLNAKGDKCPESGCVQEAGGGKFKVISGITGKDWPSTFPSRDSAENAIKKYHAGGFSRKPSTKPSEKPYGGNKGDEKKSVRDYEGPSRKSSSPVKHTLTQGGDTFNHTHTKANEGTRSKGIKVTGKKTSASGGTSRKSSSPLNNAGNIYGGWKSSNELKYNTVDDITQGKGEADYGVSRESSSPANFMGIKRPGRCTPFPNPDCEPGTPQYNLAKRLKPGGDLYKGKKKK